VALKTGTTRAYTDNWALGTTREYTVGVWAGNFDGSPTHGVISMRGATPLLRAAFTAIAGRYGDPTAVPRPPGLEGSAVCAVSGMAPGPHCARRKHELFVRGTAPDKPCTWHEKRCGVVTTRYPAELHGWLRARGRLPPPPCADALADGELQIVYPRDGARFVLEPHRPAELQVPPLRAIPATAEPRWTIDGVPAGRWIPSPGLHRVRVSLGRRSHEVTISFEL
jgi:penicillin-binding protein 1C